MARKTPPQLIPPPLASAPPRLYTGTSGWAYPSWRPDFYPEKLPPRSFLPFYASQLNTVEVNYTFRKLPTADQIASWLDSTPAGFRFSFKAPQRITHFSRLRACDTHLDDFLNAIEPAAQAGKLGLVLFQLPPNFRTDPALLAAFLALPRLRGKDAPRLAFEFRHDSWFTPEVEQILRDFQAAYCIAETDDLTTPEVHTAPTHTCFRLRQSGGYTAAELDGFLKRIVPLTGDREVYVHFKHEDEPTGALNAARFLRTAAKRDGSDGEAGSLQ